MVYFFNSKGKYGILLYFNKKKKVLLLVNFKILNLEGN